MNKKLFALTAIFTFITICLAFIIKYYRAKIAVITVYGIMITGKDASREEYAKRSINNWMTQNCTCKKHLFIVNHGEYILGSGTEHTEYKIDRGNKTLGELRNWAKEKIQELCDYSDKCYWTVWDDDDKRSNDYIQLFVDATKQNYYDVVSISTRIEHNVNNGFIWGIEQLQGLPIILCKCSVYVKYLDLNTMEDVNLINDVSKSNRVLIWRNNPFIYIRTVHKSNTSIWVNSEKNAIEKFKSEDYREFEIPEIRKKYVREIQI